MNRKVGLLAVIKKNESEAMNKGLMFGAGLGLKEKRSFISLALPFVTHDAKVHNAQASSLTP
jgi:hypothetical protein